MIFNNFLWCYDLRPKNITSPHNTYDYMPIIINSNLLKLVKVIRLIIIFNCIEDSYKPNFTYERRFIPRPSSLSNGENNMSNFKS